MRFNGGHKQSLLCIEQLSTYFTYVPVCPEQAIGLGVPREPIRLVGLASQPRAIGTINTQLDVTDALSAFGQKTGAELTDLCGYIVMQKSPSCGLLQVKVYPADSAVPVLEGRGVFTAALMQAQPNLPIEEEGRLNQPVHLDNFMTRVFAYAQWQQLLQSGLSAKKLYEFHARYKYQLMANSPSGCTALGRILTNQQGLSLELLAAKYFSLFMATLKKVANRGAHTNVLQHISGYLKRALNSEEKYALSTAIQHYQTHQQPLSATLAVLQQYFKQHPNPYIAAQVYWQPYPASLELRSTL